MSTRKYMGLSLTDRLKQAGKLEQFSSALREKNEAAAIAFLVDVEYTQPQASDTVKSLLLDPSSFRG